MNYQITAKRFNNFNIILSFDKSDEYEIKRNLYDWCARYAPGFQWNWKFKRKLWDGKIGFFTLKNNLLPIGLLNELIKFSDTFSYSLELHESLKIDNFEGSTEEESDAFINDFIKKLNLPKDRTPYDYQIKYFKHFVRKNAALMLSPTSSGKSLIIYLCLRYALNFINEKQILLIVPTTQLVEQMFNDFKSYGFDSEQHCARIYSDGKDKIDKLKTKKKIILSTWHSLQRLDPSEFDNIGLIAGDEVHEFGAYQAKKIITSCVNATYRLGTTATLKDPDSCENWTIKGLFDEACKYTNINELVKQGRISDFMIYIMNFIYSDETCNVANGMTYFDEMDFINIQEDRIQKIKKLVQKLNNRKENTLILFKGIEYGKKILDNLSDFNPHYVDGTVKVKDREKIKINMEENNTVVAVCSFGTFKRGINIKNLHNIILANTTKDEIGIIQSIGRALRTHKSKSIAKIFDIVDNMKHKSKENYALKHFHERLNIYKKNDFKIKYEDIHIN